MRAADIRRELIKFMLLKVKEFIKKEAVLVISGILAVVSMLFIPPSVEYISYIDFKTLSVLLCLMIVMAGLRKIGVFSAMARVLLERTSMLRSTMLILVLLCFFTSMAITNDVALITFVPFAIAVLSDAGPKDKVIFTVVMQTVAANLGSMLTPIGNPQNLYLYSVSGMSASEFIQLMLPYSVLSLALILICILFEKNRKILYSSPNEKITIPVKQTALYIVLFVLCLLTVAGYIPYYITLAVIIAVTVISDWTLIKKADYSLLLTFVFFFIFIGNMGNITQFRDWLANMINGRETIISVLSSQVISNVPAALLLSGFTEKYEQLIIGTNIGGLGTLIASMASLISYKYFAVFDGSKKGRYLIQFTGINLIFLAALIMFYVII